MKLSEVKTGRSVADLGIRYTGTFFNCSGEELTSLEGSPQIVAEGFYCSGNKLTTLEGGPQKVGGGFYCYKNNLISLKGAPQEVGENFSCQENKQLTSLKDIHKYIKKIGEFFTAPQCPIQSHVLGLLLIKDLKEVYIDNQEVAAIINSHLDGGSMRSAMDCQHALIKAGYPEYAKL